MKLFLTLGLLLSLVTSAGANDRIVVSNHNYNGYYNNYNQVVVLEKQVVFDSRYYLGQPAYYAIGQNFQAPSFALATQAQALNGLGTSLKTINDNIITVSGKLDTLTNAINQIQPLQPVPPPVVPPSPPTPTPEPPQPSPTPNPTPNPEPTPTPPPSPTPQPTPNPQPNPNDTTELDKLIYPIVQSKCASCHGPELHKGDLILFKDGVLQKPALADLILIAHRVEGTDLEDGETRMPAGKPALPDNEVKLFKLWAVEEAKALNK